MEKFHELGRAAHEAGKVCDPRIDELLWQAVRDDPFADASDAVQRWTVGWDTANRGYRDRMAELRYQPYTEGGQP